MRLAIRVLFIEDNFLFANQGFAAGWHFPLAFGLRAGPPVADAVLHRRSDQHNSITGCIPQQNGLWGRLIAALVTADGLQSTDGSSANMLFVWHIVNQVSLGSIFDAETEVLNSS
jgi:hypothetical protein